MEVLYFIWSHILYVFNVMRETVVFRAGHGIHYTLTLWDCCFDTFLIFFVFRFINRRANEDDE